MQRINSPKFTSNIFYNFKVNEDCQMNTQANYCNCKTRSVSIFQKCRLHFRKVILKSTVALRKEH